MRKKVILLIAIILYLPYSLWSQATQNFIPNIISPAPNIAGLIKYAEVPVSNYNGTASFSVPLYDIKENDINLPISLSYYSNGLKVEEEASWVGLGWNVNAGGAIQHISNKGENEGPGIIPNYVTANPPQDLTYVNSQCYRTTNMIQGGCEYQNEGGGNVEVSHETIRENKGYKYEMFLYNFAGYSGKFIIDRSGGIVVLDQSNIIFTVTGKDSLGNPIAVYATTPDGNKYSFEIVGYSESRYSPGGPCSSLPGLNIVHNNSYYLSKIVTPLKNEILFDYTLNITKSLPHITETYTHYLVRSAAYNDSRVLSTSTNDVHEYLLKSIKTSNTEIKFNLSIRDDVLNGKKLQNITIHKRNENLPIKTINFNYQYFEGNLFFGDSNDQSSITSPYKIPTCRTLLPAVATNLKSKRLKLLNIFFSKEPIATYTGNLPKYSFEYEPGVIPYKTSLSYDLWGYFNGGGASKSAIPNLKFIDFYETKLPAYFYETENLEKGQRHTNTSYSKMGLLNKITQPTGGYTKITYEANSFYPPDGVTPVLDKTIDVFDYNSTSEQSYVFELSSFALKNPITLDVTLNCSNDGPCQQFSGDCPPYEAVSDQSMITAGNDYRLFAILEKKDPNYTGGWRPVFKYGRNSPELLQEGPCYHHFLDSQVRSRLEAFTQYRIRVNYPDEKIGSPGRVWAQMRLNYKEQDTNITNILGAGLRISSIIEVDGNKSYNEKKYSYSGGKLMSRPIFYQMRGDFTSDHPSFTSIATLGQVASFKRICPPAALMDDFLGKNMPNIFVRLSSEAQVPYSYGANGSLVGYSTVKVDYGNNQTLTQNPDMGNGSEEFNYINTTDNLFYYDGLIPGISGSKFMNNGLLTSKKDYKIRHITSYTIPPGYVNAGVNYVREIYPVKTEIYKYDIRNYKDYWAFKADYSDIHFTNGTSPTDSRLYFVHFYPVKTGKIILNSKTVTNYSSSLIPTENVINITDYTYNSKYQLINEKTKNSQNNVIESKTYYPDDLKSSGFQQGQMQELITQNRIDLPIKIEMVINGSSVSKKETKYIKDVSTGNLLLPKEVHSLKGLGAINVTTSNDRKITFNQYDDKGNILQYTPESSSPVSIIWGYNKTQPIAKIENSTYTGITASLITAAQTASDTGTEATLLTALTNLRNALPNAMVTTYTHIPLVGVSTITDPKGDKITYTYDSFGRLQFVKDKNGNILSENQYNYKQ